LLSLPFAAKLSHQTQSEFPLARRLAQVESTIMPFPAVATCLGRPS